MALSVLPLRASLLKTWHLLTARVAVWSEWQAITEEALDLMFANLVDLPINAATLLNVHTSIRASVMS